MLQRADELPALKTPDRDDRVAPHREDHDAVLAPLDGRLRPLGVGNHGGLAVTLIAPPASGASRHPPS